MSTITEDTDASGDVDDTVDDTVEESVETDDAVETADAANGGANLAVSRGAMRLGDWSRRQRIIAAVVVVALLGAAGFFAWHRSQALPDDAAFKYGDTVVTTAALNERVDVLGALYGVQKPTDAAQLDTFQRAAAQANAMTLILDDAAADAGIVISDKAARDTLSKMLSQQLAGDPQQAYDALLTKYGVSDADVLLEVKRQQSIALLFRQVTKDVTGAPSDADVTAYFEQHKAEFATPPRRHLLNIVVGSRADARRIARIADASNFKSLARQHSLDDSTRESGGDLGSVAVADLDDAYAKAAFAAARNSVFGPVKTSYGWNVGLVLGATKGRPANLAKIRSTVVANMQSERALTAWRDWLGQRIKDAGVRYADAYRPSDPDAVPAIQGVPGQGSGQ